MMQRSATIYRGMADFMIIQCICVALVVVFPSIAMWFPNWLQERAKAERVREHGAVPSKPVPVAAADDAAREHPSRPRARSRR